jgi:hypothetical protein
MQDANTRNALKVAVPTHHDNNKVNKKELDKLLSVLIADEELDNKALVIMLTLKDRKKMF